MKKILLTGLGLILLALGIVFFWIARVLADLPDVATLKNYRPAAASEVTDKDGNILTQYYERKFRIWVPLSSLPDVVIQAVVTAEDDTFFGHQGVNYKATWDALVHDAQKGRFARGGSTITQQMIKNVLLSKEKTLSRKIREYVLARKAEEILTKRRILEIYLNEVEWGDNIYGIEAASRYYFDKHAAELSTREAALLAGMLPNPRYFNPNKRPDKARKRQERVLSNMLQAKLISPEEFTIAMQSPLQLRAERGGKFDFTALDGGRTKPCYQAVLERILVNIAGEKGLHRQGLKIMTTLDRSLQNDLSKFDEALPDRVQNAPDRIVMITRGGKVRALVCATAVEASVRSRLGINDSMDAIASEEYTVSIVSAEAIAREQIIMSMAGGLH